MFSSKASCDPPFEEHYKTLLHDSITKCSQHQVHEVVGECELPVIDLSGLRSSDEEERHACVAAIAKASSEWGFFQALSHGISTELLGEMRREQMKLFEMPFEKKVSSGVLNNSYRWGTPTAMSLNQFSWSEAFHVPLEKISEEDGCDGEFNSLTLRYLPLILHLNLLKCPICPSFDIFHAQILASHLIPHFS